MIEAIFKTYSFLCVCTYYVVQREAFNLFSKVGVPSVDAIVFTTVWHYKVKDTNTELTIINWIHEVTECPAWVFRKRWLIR